MTDQQIDFKNYLDLIKKVDDKFDQIYSAEKQSFSCKKGCHACCLPDLSVSKIEKEFVKDFLNQNEEKVAQLREIESSNPHNNARCSFLSACGECVIYPVRPLICRSHGAPILIPEKNNEIDVCPLNFRDKDPQALDGELKINIKIVNTILALINITAFPDSNEQRFELKVDQILSDES